MEQSLFLEWVQKYFPGIVIRTVETLNDTKRPLSYLHKSMLTPDYSVTGTWEALSAQSTLVAADFVSMDSSLPLKMRDAISKATGDIPKQGMELYLNEKQLTQLDVLVAQNAPESVIVQKLFRDTARCIGGIYENNELAFLIGLSTGVTVVSDADRPGIGIRMDFGYLTANKFGASVLWTDSAADPIYDIERVIAKASLDGNVITKILTDDKTIVALGSSVAVKRLFSFNATNGVADTTNIPDLLFNDVNALFQKRYNITLVKVDRVVKTEKNGVRTSVKPWSEGKVVFVCSDTVGSLAWATLAEKNHPVKNVEYETADEYILVSKYRQNKPSLSEWTSSQARVVPVIANVDEIYLLDSKTLQP